MKEQCLCLLDSKKDDEVAVPVCTQEHKRYYPTPSHPSALEHEGQMIRVRKWVTFCSLVRKWVWARILKRLGFLTTITFIGGLFLILTSLWNAPGFQSSAPVSNSHVSVVGIVLMMCIILCSKVRLKWLCSKVTLQTVLQSDPATCWERNSTRRFDQNDFHFQCLTHVL